MPLKSNMKGFTLVELIIAITLLSVILASAYYFLAFSVRSFHYMEAQYEAEQEARWAQIAMEDDIRKAKTVIIGGTNHKAVEVLNSGMQLNVYTDTDKDGVMELVQYILDANKLKRGEAELGSTPTDWTVVADRVYNADETPAVSIFSVNGKKIGINLMIGDEGNYLEEEPVSMVTSVTVRSKGAMD